MKNLLKGGFFHKIVKKRLRFWRSLRLLRRAKMNFMLALCDRNPLKSRKDEYRSAGLTPNARTSLLMKSHVAYDQLAALEEEKVRHKPHSLSVQWLHKSQHSTSTPI